MPVIGFKDWAVISAAMACGEQSLIIRKGGIAEGRDGFQFKHPEFFLFPTGYHEQLEKLRTAPNFAVPAIGDGIVHIAAAFRLEWSAAVTSWDAARDLAPFHLYREEVVRERFEYDDAPGLQIAFGRVLRVAPNWSFPASPRFGGCRSWINLPEGAPALDGLPAVLADATHEQRASELSTWAARHRIELRPPAGKSAA